MSNQAEFVEIDPKGGTNRPKDFPLNEKKLVRREELMNNVLEKLEAAVNDRSQVLPGVYMSGPAGAGKSVLAFAIAQICRVDKKWLTIYISDCRAWAPLDPNDAMGFFLDRVMEALELGSEATKNDFIQISKILSPESLEAAYSGATTWEIAAAGKNLSGLYKQVRHELSESDHPVAIVCDEINALWDMNKPRYNEVPWNLTRFQPMFLKGGALLLTGTTDNDFISCVPDGLEKHIVAVGRCRDDEIKSMLGLDHLKILTEVQSLSEDLWRSIADAAGNIPRELLNFVNGLKKEEIEGLHQNLGATEDQKSVLHMKMEDRIKDWRKKNVSRHKNSLDRVLKGQNGGIFLERLLETCESLFVKGVPAQLANEVLRMPNFVIEGNYMHPTTFDAQDVYFDWFCRQEREPFRNTSVANLFRTFMEESLGSVRGTAFEEFMAAKLTVLGKASPNFELSLHRLNESPDTSRKYPISIQQRVFTLASCPPKNFQHFADNTLLTHTDPNGGEARVDMIHYRKDRVLYIEATVGHYPTSKFPKKDDSTDQRVELILKTLRKWLGEDVFDVTIENICAAGSTTSSSPKRLSVTYRALKTRANTNRPNPPELHYIVATTCPKKVQPEASRINMYNWIEVCFLEDLIASGIIPADKEKAIIEKQGKNAK